MDLTRALGGLAASAVLAGCTLGHGEGEVHSDRLLVAECWDGTFDLLPDFFASVPFRETQSIRIQKGGDMGEISDGVVLQVDEVPRIREELLGSPIPVRLPPGIAPPGSVPDPCAAGCDGSPQIALALYLHSTCHNQNAALYALSGTITFDSLFSGDPNEGQAAEKLTSATFDVMIGDPRDAPLGAAPTDVPAELQSSLTGWFEFYFERGRPAQPFP